ncbi:hypothetical protein ACLMJK_004324 [Lecanora helva]
MSSTTFWLTVEQLTNYPTGLRPEGVDPVYTKRPLPLNALAMSKVHPCHHQLMLQGEQNRLDGRQNCHDFHFQALSRAEYTNWAKSENQGEVEFWLVLRRDRGVITRKPVEIWAQTRSMHGTMEDRISTFQSTLRPAAPSFEPGNGVGNAVAVPGDSPHPPDSLRSLVEGSDYLLPLSASNASPASKMLASAAASSLMRSVQWTNVFRCQFGPIAPPTSTSSSNSSSRQAPVAPSTEKDGVKPAPRETARPIFYGHDFSDWVGTHEDHRKFLRRNLFAFQSTSRKRPIRRHLQQDEFPEDFPLFGNEVRSDKGCMAPPPGLLDD